MDVIRMVDTYSVRKFVTTLAGRSGLTVQWHTDSTFDGAYTDSVTKVIYVQRPCWDWNEHEYLLWFGKVLHECGHWKDENADDLMYFLNRKTDMSSLFGKLVNMLTDYKQDQQWLNEYEGADEAIEYLQSHCASTGILAVIDQMGKEPFSDSMMLLARCFTWTYNARAAWHKRMMISAADWEATIPAGNLYDYTEELNSMSDGADIHALVKKILEANGFKEEVEKEEENSKKPDSGKPGDIPLTPQEQEMLKKLLADDHSEQTRPKLEENPYRKDGQYVPYDRYKEIDCAKEFK